MPLKGPRSSYGGRPTGRLLLAKLVQMDTEGCLLWPRSVDSDGYGSVWTGTRLAAVHREVCRIVHGEPPADKPEAAHSCGNRQCANWKHIRWASRQENIADMKIHGTRPGNPGKVSRRVVDEILSSTETINEIALRLGIARQTIRRIKSRNA